MSAARKRDEAADVQTVIDLIGQHGLAWLVERAAEACEIEGDYYADGDGGDNEGHAANLYECKGVLEQIAKRVVMPVVAAQPEDDSAEREAAESEAEYRRRERAMFDATKRGDS